jgi:hypothetical protein
MQEHDGKIDSAIDHKKKFRWSVEIKDGDNPILKDCFFLPEVVEPYNADPLLRTLSAAKRWIPAHDDHTLGFSFFKVSKDSSVYKTLESLDFDKRYTVTQHLHQGWGMPGQLIESWQLNLCQMRERLVKAQDHLFTISLLVEYFEIKYIPVNKS